MKLTTKERSLFANSISCYREWDTSGVFLVFSCKLFCLLECIFREAALNDALDGVDISVHCDVSIFAWLMDYIRADENVVDIDLEKISSICIHDLGMSHFR